jgi:signal transduction histidine kinase
MVLMKQYNISPTNTHHMFLDAVHRYLVWASLSAMVLAVIFSFFLTRKVLRPLSQMTEITERIAAGDYTERVPLIARDEIGQLAAAFNRMTDSLRRIEHLRRTLVSDVAHELRTPLTNLRGYLEALRDGVASPSQETFELLHEETLRLVILVADLLDLTKVEAARTTLQKQRIVLQDLIDRDLEMFESQFVAKGISVKIQGINRLDSIMGDPDKLTQAMRNLFQNALQYTSPGGHVRITTEHIPGAIKLSVSNTGEGISQEDLPFIFERFYRGEKSRSRERGGAGIGLAIVKELIEAHGGQVGAETSANDTRVWFTLPV